MAAFSSITYRPDISFNNFSYLKKMSISLQNSRVAKEFRSERNWCHGIDCSTVGAAVDNGDSIRFDSRNLLQRIFRTGRADHPAHLQNASVQQPSIPVNYNMCLIDCPCCLCQEEIANHSRVPLIPQNDCCSFVKLSFQFLFWFFYKLFCFDSLLWSADTIWFHHHNYFFLPLNF